MRRLISVLCAIGQLAFANPAFAQSIGIGLSNGPFSLSLSTGRPQGEASCTVQTVPTGGTVRLRRGMEVESITCTDERCAEQLVRICPADE